MNMKKMSMNHVILAKEEQLSFILPFNIVPDISFLTVNGESNEGFTLEDHELVFEEPLAEGDRIIISFDLINADILHLFKERGKSLFRQKGKEQKFKYNREYVIELDSPDVKYSNSFKTYFDPFFAQIHEVRRETGTLLDLVEDILIAEIIHDNSVFALEKHTEKDEFGSDDEALPSYISKYVRYRTALDLAYAAYVSITGKIGRESKKIRNITIEKETKLPYINDMLSELRKKLAEQEALLVGSKVQIRSFVKGGSAEYPIATSRRGF